MFIANCYVDLGDHIAAPGELIERDPNAEWHLKIGAICEATPEKAKRKPTVDATPPAKDAEDEQAQAEAAEAEDEAHFEEPEAPEIDVTEALVSADATPKKSAAPKRSRRTAKEDKAK